VVFDGVGHFPHAEVPDRFVDVLVEFVETTEPAVLSREELGRVLRERSGAGTPPDRPEA
jgi:hypothetical protein